MNKAWILLLALLLTACAAPPKPQDAPRQLLLDELGINPGHGTAQAPGLLLAIERPLAATPLRSREIWYWQANHQLAPFSNYRWAESLDVQLQHLLSAWLAQESWVQASLPDQPGYQADYRLRLTLNQWYLNPADNTLQISLQLNLLQASGRSLLQRQWTLAQPVEDTSPSGLAVASQAWLQGWAREVSQLLHDHLATAHETRN